MALIGTIAGVISAIGVPIAYLQLRVERDRRREHRQEIPGALVTQFEDLALFAPDARYRGYDVGVVDRRQETATLLRQLRAGRSVVAIEGFAGVGKTTLAAHVCARIGRGRSVHWVFCDEKGPAVTLTSLAKALAASADSTESSRLRAAVTRKASTSDVIDGIVDFLAARRMLLVFDNFHTVTDPGVNELLVRLEHSRTVSSVIVTSRRLVPGLGTAPLVGELTLHGLSDDDARTFLRERGVSMSEKAVESVWHQAGDGNPLALTLFAGRARATDPEELAMRLPDSIDDFDEWIALAFEALPTESDQVAKVIAFGYEPLPRAALVEIAAPLDPSGAVQDLTARFLVKENSGRYEMHSAVRDYVIRQISDAEQSDLAARFTGYYGARARTVFVDGLGSDEPSYGMLYVESFPDYFAAVDRHIRFVDDLIDRLADNGHTLARGDRILVLGSGNGTHDPGFAKHGLDITDVDIQPEIVDLGRANAESLPAKISYVVADMTEPLPAELAAGDMAAVFNIGSSFGYESSDDTNAMVFRNAASALSPGAPFVFEFVNGPHWENKRVQRQVDVTQLDNGTTRTEVSITNPDAGTALTLIGLRRANGTAGWFRHFMRYYRSNEIVQLMEDAGLRIVATYGAIDGRVTGQRFDEQNSQAMVIIATRADSNTTAAGARTVPAERTPAMTPDVTSTD